MASSTTTADALPAAAEAAPALGPAPRRSPALTAVVALGLAALAAGLLALLYAASVHADPASSDGATVVLEGKAMAGGNLGLHGWSLSLDSFWTVDAVLYALAVLVAGVRGVFLDLVPAILAVGVVALGAAMARDGRRGGAGIAGAVTVVALVGLPSRVLAVFLLKGPLHVGTTLLCLLAFWALRSGRFDARWVGAVAAMAAGILGDVQMLSLAVVPVMLAGVAAGARTRRWRRAVPAVAAGAAAVVLAGVVRLVAQALGTFALASPQPRAGWSQVPANVAHVFTFGAAILGVGSSAYGLGGVPPALEAVHVVGLAVLVAAVLAAAWSLASGTARGRPAAGEGDGGFLDDVLVVAVAADAATFVLLSSSSTLAFGRYLTAGVIFGAVLAGRAVARLAAGRACAPASLRAGLGAAALAVTATFGAGVGFNLAQPPAVTSASQLGAFLAAHDLRLGVGDYWSASIVTVLTDDSVVIRPVIARPGGRLVRYGKQTTSSWYAGEQFQFLVYNGANPWGGVDRATATGTFGAPAHVYTVGTYSVLVFPRPVTVSTAGWSG